MSTLKQQSGDERLGTLLRESRPQPGLPPRFQQNVWRRIEQPDTRNNPTNWVEILASLFLKPRFAVTTICTVLVAGALLGSWTGSVEARQLAQERYVAAVIMPVAP